MVAKTTYPKDYTQPGRISLRMKEINDMILNQGINVRVTPSIICPNRSGDQNDEAGVNHPLDCPLCNGNQVVDLDAMAFNTWALVTNVKIDTQIDQNRFDVKDALMTTKFDVKIHYWYKVELVDHTSQFNQIVKRTSLDYDVCRYAPIDVSNGEVFALIDSAGTLYVRDTDYVIEGKNIVWQTTKRPDVDSLYSFLYPVLPTFRVIDLMHENRYYYDSERLPQKSPVNLPQQSHLRWDYMAKNVEAT